MAPVTVSPIEQAVCNLFIYQGSAGRDITRAMIDETGNLPLFPGDYAAPMQQRTRPSLTATAPKMASPIPRHMARPIPDLGEFNLNVRE
jgi:hypothetical protein